MESRKVLLNTHLRDDPPICNRNSVQTGDAECGRTDVGVSSGLQSGGHRLGESLIREMPPVGVLTAKSEREGHVSALSVMPKPARNSSSYFATLNINNETSPTLFPGPLEPSYKGIRATCRVEDKRVGRLPAKSCAYEQRCRACNDCSTSARHGGSPKVKYLQPTALRCCCRGVRRSRASPRQNIPRAAAPRIRP